jgi:hypothetical protein
MSAPQFAVVGHPNKGKSSLVATLARDTSVRIGPEPGTTKQARTFPMRIDGTTLYSLIDTPGFQRARAALDWMQKNSSDAASRPTSVERFVETHSREGTFEDECALLRPIIDGAGIIYVVDGATPYGPEYEAEMEILRWTGRPSMAIINPIGTPRFVEQWEKALGQFFRVVRVLDVMVAPFKQQTEILRAFGQLSADWRTPLEQAVEALEEDRERQLRDSAQIIAELIAGALCHSETKEIGKNDNPQPHIKKLEEQFRGRLRQLERKARSEIESIYRHNDLDRRESDFEIIETDLLSRESWLAFGLKKRDLVAVGAVSGAVAGGVIDVALLGASFLTGSLIGGAIGGTLGYFSSDRLADAKIMRQPLGGLRLRYGPTKNLQFPFVLLGRARHHHTLIAGRTHAQRGSLEVNGGDGKGIGAHNPLSDSEKRKLGSLFDRLRRSEGGSERSIATLADLANAIEELLKNER